MSIYWILFSIPAFATLFPLRADKELKKILWLLVFIFFLFIVGFRYEVGGDWFVYQSEFAELSKLSIIEGATSGNSDIAFVVLNKISYIVGGGYYLVNFVSAFIFLYGIWRFAYNEPFPWLVLTIAASYLIIIVGMGYVRQSASIGFIFLAIAKLREGRNISFIANLFVSVLFHKVAIFMLILGLFQLKNKIYKAILFVIITATFSVFLYKNFEFMFYGYIVDQYMFSYGAIPRVMLNVVSALLLVIYMSKMHIDAYIASYAKHMAYTALLVAPFVVQYSTPVDRFQMFLTPIQLLAFGRIPLLFNNESGRYLSTIVTIFISMLVMFVWLFFGSHSSYWIPYSNTLITIHK